MIDIDVIFTLDSFFAIIVYISFTSFGFFRILNAGSEFT